MAVSDVVNSMSNNIDPRWLWRANVFLESLTASVWCPSFPRSPYPEFYPEDSAAERAAKLMKLESNHPKFGWQLLRRKSARFMGRGSLSCYSKPREAVLCSSN
ncbi:hypothetical protein AP9108_34565 [Arthrospira sp. PCC 9108]|nr:hypothetical protein AP9108_34985 [Arthrospira sp. PCC 9108]WAK74593.1 hypothetical protein AP9108_34565 [Arthrospira sp. PCC 9108]